MAPACPAALLVTTRVLELVLAADADEAAAAQLEAMAELLERHSALPYSGALQGSGLSV